MFMIPKVPQIAYLGRSVVSAGSELDITWEADCEAVILEYRNITISDNDKNIELRLSNDGGASFISSGAYGFRGVLSGTGFGTTTVPSASTVFMRMALATGVGAGQGNGANENGAYNVIIPRPFDTGQRTAGFAFGDFRGDTIPLRYLTFGQRAASERNDGVRMRPGLGTISGEVRAYGLMRYPGNHQMAPSALLHPPGVPVLEPIAQQEANDSANLDFFWQGDYDAIFVLIDNAAPTINQDGLAVRLSSDGSTFPTTGYQSRGAIYTSQIVANTQQTHIALMPHATVNGPRVESIAESGVSGLLTLYRPNDPADKTTLHALGGYFNAAGNFSPFQAAGYYDTAGMTNGMRFQNHAGASGTINRGRFTMWGLRRR